MPNSRRVREVGRAGIYGRPAPVRSRRRPEPKLQINFRSLLAGVVLVAFGLWIWHYFNVQEVKVSGSRNYSSDLVKQATWEQLESHWWWRNEVLLDPRKLQAGLLRSQPQLATASITRVWPHRLQVHVTERNPNLGWLTGGQLYLLSDDGVVVAKAGSGQRLPVVEDSTNLPVQPGDQVVPARFVTFCDDLIRLLPKQGLQITKLQIPVTTSEVYATTGAGYYIKFDTTRPATQEVGDLVKVLALLKSQNRHPNQYIDLRIANKAYYQ